MIRLKIDNKDIEVKEGTPVISAARSQGIDVPSMCYLEGKEHITSCMICMVKDRNTSRLFPSCSIESQDGMDIITMDEEIHEARKTALELLLSEHVGDCEAPCQITCPAHMDIPLMNRLLAEGKFHEALKVVKKDIALPAVFGRICPAPCEGACRRKSVDEAVSICLLKRYAGDHDLQSEKSWLPQMEEKKGKKVAIIGAGPAGLSLAHYLQIRGYDSIIFDRNDLPGGSLHREVKDNNLPIEVLLSEIEILKKMGVKFNMNTPVDRASFDSLEKNNDALVIATGSKNGMEDWGLEMTDKGIKADNKTYQVNNSSVFVIGSALKPSRMAIRTLGQGKEAAFSVNQFLQGEELRGEPFLFNSRFGKLQESEAIEYLKESLKGKRIEPKDQKTGLTSEEVRKEAARCLHCDCRDLENCRLRIYSGQYMANQRRFKSESRKQMVKHFQHETVIYEPSKCIRCGICVKICSDYQEEFGMSFIGRGFEIEVGIPFNESVKKGLEKVAEEAAMECPTGALVLKDK